MQKHKALKVGLHKVAEHRGRKRLWLEGRSLERIGFRPGERYTVELNLDSRELVLRLTLAGERQVSRKARGNRRPIPIIDLLDDSLRSVAGEAGRIEASLYQDGVIVCRLHPQDAAKQERETRLMRELEQGTLTEGVLCAGGGISAAATKEGFERAGLTCRVEWVVDREPAYLEAALDNNVAVATARIFEAALEELDVEYVTPVSCLQMSLPCTGHSISGKSKNKLSCAEEHPTDALALFGAVKIIEAARPAIIISENVVQAASSATYTLLRGYLGALGYRIFERNLDEKDAGCLERRTRWWFVALSSGIAEGFDLESLPARPRKNQTLGEVLEDVPHDDPMWSRNDYLAAKADRDAAAGKGFARQFVDCTSTGVGTVGKGYWRRRSTEPFVRRGDGMERLLTKSEHAAVKGIPPHLVEDLTATLAHEILGQSILWEHATVLAEKIGQHLSGRVEIPVVEESEPVGQLQLFKAA